MSTEAKGLHQGTGLGVKTMLVLFPGVSGGHVGDPDAAHGFCLHGPRSVSHWEQACACHSVC